MTEAIDTKLGAKCPACQQHMLVAIGCKFKRIEFKDGTIMKKLKYGDNGEDTSGRCRDCGCKPWHFHHLNCDQEVCPRCKGQALSCDCEPVADLL
jgi:hypothetical protein